MRARQLVMSIVSFLTPDLPKWQCEIGPQTEISPCPIRDRSTTPYRSPQGAWQQRARSSSCRSSGIRSRGGHKGFSMQKRNRGSAASRVLIHRTTLRKSSFASCAFAVLSSRHRSERPWAGEPLAGPRCCSQVQSTQSRRVRAAPPLRDPERPWSRMDVLLRQLLPPNCGLVESQSCRTQSQPSS